LRFSRVRGFISTVSTTLAQTKTKSSDKMNTETETEMVKVEFRDRFRGREGMVRNNDGGVRYFTKADAEAYCAKYRNQNCQFWVSPSL
jgi:hypothetical protein